MSARRVAFRQCDVERALKAAIAVGAGLVVVRPDGSIAIEVEIRAEQERLDERPYRRGKEIVL